MAPLGYHLLSLLIFLILDSSPSSTSIAVPNTSSLDHVASCDGPEPSQARRPQRVLNVDDYGAQGDGVTDDREAFERAWKKACRSHVPTVLLVPEDKNYLLKPVVFSGPCKSHITMMISGTIIAPSNRSVWDGRSTRHWIVFYNIRNLLVTGGGMVYGSGQIWWQNSCKINTTLPCTVAPTALTFFACRGLRIEDLRIEDSQQIHVSIEKCRDVQVSNLAILAPEESPNTDGIHVTDTKNVVITNCEIKTGDDCVSVVSGSQNVRGVNLFCGPGHGISVGSLGANNSRSRVRDVIMDTVTIVGTMNGVRVKTWQGGRGYAKNIVFQNIGMHNVRNPIIIDQNYCDSTEPCPEKRHAVAISRVKYKNIKGISASDVSVKFDCSKRVPCRGIVLQDIDLVGEGGESTRSSCNNVDWTGIGELVPTPCEQGS